MTLTRHPLHSPSFHASVTQPFGVASTLKLRLWYAAYGGVHPGIDFSGPNALGRPIFHVVNKGRVIEAGRAGGWGYRVKVRCEVNGSNSVGVFYAHLSRIASSIAVGRLVTEGQVIGYVGSTGLSTGPHLHFGYWDTSLAGVSSQHWVNPAPYFAAGGVQL